MKDPSIFHILFVHACCACNALLDGLVLGKSRRRNTWLDASNARHFEFETRIRVCDALEEGQLCSLVLNIVCLELFQRRFTCAEIERRKHSLRVASIE